MITASFTSTSKSDNNNYKIKRSSSIKFLGVFVDENLLWVDQITTVNKLSKNIVLLFKAKNYLNQKSLVNLYYSFIHSYLNSGNISWCSAYITKPKSFISKPKQIMKRALYFEYLPCTFIECIKSQI